MSRDWTPAQLRAIAARDRTLVAAAAGSGKTSVLTELVVQALVAREASPAEVCAVTFTEKAAQEMRGRIAERLGELGERELLDELELARIGTIHSLCATVLRSYGAAIGIDPAAAVFDEAQLAWLLRQAVRDTIGALAGHADVHWLRARMGDDRVEATLLGIHRCAAQTTGTAQLVAPADIVVPLHPKTSEPLLPAADARRAQHAYSELWADFETRVDTRQRALGRLSFDDLERLAVDAVRIHEVATALRARWSLILVDEFQDTNERQYELLHTIGGDRLFMVGDEWQSIYRFRGADVAVFRQRRHELGVEAVVQMRENFRSSGPVLDVVNRVFGSPELFGERYEPVLAGTDAQRGAGAPAVELLVVPENEQDGDVAAPDAPLRQREALRVAERIAELVESGDAQPGDIALLYARGTGVDHYEDALRAWGLPVLRAASGGYYDQRDVRDALAVLAVVRNPADDHAMLGVLAGPVGSLEWTELHAVRAAATDAGTTLLTEARDSTVASARRAAEAVDELHVRARGCSLVELVSAVTQLPELELGAAAETDGVVRVANLRRLVELAASAHEVGIDGVAGFLEFVAAQRRDARVGEASIADETLGAVRLLTIHASKGLEFPFVFVVEAGQHAAGRPSAVPDPRTDAHGIVHLGLPLPYGRCVETALHAELSEAGKEAEAEERLRLWYVAMTRAKQRLFISGRWNFTPTATGKPRSVRGALRWLQAALSLDETFGGPGLRRRELDDLVLLDTHPARRTPERIWHVARATAELRHPQPLPPVPDAEASAPLDPQDRYRMQQSLRDALAAARDDEWRQQEGTRLHDAVARMLDAARAGTAPGELLDPEDGVWMTDAVRARLTPVVRSAVFRALVDVGARAEVPYIAAGGALTLSAAAPGVDIVRDARDIDAGRIDALAILPDGAWWIVDWKATLPESPGPAWDAHGAQLARYARAAAAAGASAITVTLVPLDAPERAVSWSYASQAAASAATADSHPERASIPQGSGLTRSVR